MMWYGMGWMWLIGVVWLVALAFILSLVFWSAKKLVEDSDRKRR